MAKVDWLSTPLFAKWYVTNRCNLRCSHCYLNSYEDAAETARMIKVANVLGKAGIKYVAMLGGEPLARTDLETIIATLVACDVRIKIATNATMLSSERAARLVDAGATAFQVELACSTGVSSVRFAAFIPIGTGAQQANLQLDHAMCLAVAEQLLDIHVDSSIIDIDPGPFLRRITFPVKADATALSFGCGAGTTTIVINSDLTLSACDMQTETDRVALTDFSPSGLLAEWGNADLFKQWRGLSDNPRYEAVHQHGCHIAFRTYGENLFGDEVSHAA